MEARRKPRQAKGQGMCFDDIVDEEGALRHEPGTIAATTAAKAEADESGLRHRAAESKAATFGSTVANSFADQTCFDQHHKQGKEQSDEVSISRSSTPTLPMSPPVPPKPAAYQAQRLVDTKDPSNDASEQLVDLTPTTSTSSAADDLAELARADHDQSQSSYLSVDEWAQYQSRHSMPLSPQSGVTGSVLNKTEPTDGSITHAVEQVGYPGTQDTDTASEFDELINTPSTWTEIGSQYSEE